MKAEKVKLTEYQCPSCGADLHYREDQFMITCTYCGARVERELDRSEHEKVSARKQLKIVKKYYEDMLTLGQLEKNRRLAKERVKLCSANSLSELTFTERFPYLVFAAAVVISTGIYLSAGESVFVRVICLLILLSSLPAFIVFLKRGKDKKQLIKESKARLDEAQKAFVRAGDELEAFDKAFNREPIPERYRDIRSLEYLIHVFETFQASTMGEGYKLCDDYIAQERIENMKREQLARVMILTESLRQERATTAVSSDSVPLMRRGLFAEMVMAKRKDESDSDKGADLMIALAKAAAKPENTKRW